MLRHVFHFTRPLALALAVFILLNLLLALQRPLSSATRVWLNVQLPEPLLSVFAGSLGIALLLPHELGRRPWVRWLLGGVIFGFCILVGANVIGYYHRLYYRHFTTHFAFPFSAVILLTLLLEFARVSWWVPVRSRLPAPARVFVRGTLITGSFFFLILVHIVTYGNTDYRRPADAAVILGAKVYADGELSPALRDRVETGVQLFDRGLVSYLIMSGGVGPNGASEPKHMARHAQSLGVPISRIIWDEEGVNTLQSARNCRVIAEEYDFKQLLTVSQPFHCARIKLIFEREGTHCYTVPAVPKESRSRGFRVNFYFLREALAYPFYFLYHS
ncbi:MAG: YdcF family protein [Planctomycetota bacterium]|nr:YdcF family protein [Planctomycetota bacterium]